MEKKEIIQGIVETSGDITGSIGGAVLGSLILGGAGGPIITKLFKTIGNEIIERVLSPRENLRIAATYTFAINKINENLTEGKTLRSDGFFNSLNGRPFSEEILEGTLLAAQKEHEERKVEFLGNLYGNISTDSSISRDQANQLIKITNSLTYRQLCLINLYNIKSKTAPFKNYSPPKNEITPFDIIAEIRDLHQKGLLIIQNTSQLSDLFDCYTVNITSGGKFYNQILELNKLDINELEMANKLVDVVNPTFFRYGLVSELNKKIPI